MGVTVIGVPLEAAAEVGMELVGNGRMNVRCDPLVEHLRPLAAEEQTSFGHGWPAHAQLVTAAGKQLAVLAVKAFRADLRLPVAPARVSTRKRSVIRVPHGDRTRVQCCNNLLVDSAFVATAPVDRLMQPRELLHWNAIEPHD